MAKIIARQKSKNGVRHHLCMEPPTGQQANSSVRDLAFLVFLLLILLAAFKRPWVMSLGYIWADILQPQRLGYHIQSLPVSLITALLAVILFFTMDRARGWRMGLLQSLILLMLAWVTLTSFMAMLPEHAWVKWDATWKVMAFGIFLPMVLVNRQRLEAALAFFVISIGAITMSGAMKTLLGGGGYGKISFLQDVNSKLFEGSTIATVAIATIPLIYYLYRHSVIIPRTRWSQMAAIGLVVSALLVPVGAEARTGLIAVAALALLLWWQSKRKILLALLGIGLAIASVPFLPQSFKSRMATIETYQEDGSALGRLAVWKWTIAFANEHPITGGGFGAYRLNHVDIVMMQRQNDAASEKVRVVHHEVRAKAFHSAYFEVLGEHGYVGLFLYLVMISTAFVQLWQLHRLRRKNQLAEAWISHMASAMLMSLIIYMVGAAFVGIAFQSPLYLLLGICAALIMVARKVPRLQIAKAVFMPRPLAMPQPLGR